MDANKINWTRLGRELRQSAMDAHGREHFPSVNVAYAFLMENPECFGYDEWPADMPAEPNIELIAAYYGVLADALPEVANVQ
jgi:hypothetical protein